MPAQEGVGVSLDAGMKERNPDNPRLIKDADFGLDAGMKERNRLTRPPQLACSAAAWDYAAVSIKVFAASDGTSTNTKYSAG